MEERLQVIRELGIGSKAIHFFTEDCETITFVDVEANLVEYYRYATASCGCCSEIIEHKSELDRFLSYMGESDFIDLIDELKRQH